MRLSGMSKEDCERALREMRKIPGVLAIALVRRDGVVIEDLLPASVEADRVAAMTAAIVGTAETALEEMGRGAFEHSIIEAQGGKIISMGAGKDALLVALVKPEANVGLALLTMGKQASKVGDLIAGS